MKIAITGARGTVGKLAVKACAAAGHHTVQVDRTHQEFDGTKKSEMRTADIANDYDATLKAFKGSVNAVGLAYANRPLHFDYFPLDEEAPQRPTDAYALAKEEAECQARSFVNWFPGMNIACLRIHEVAPLKDVQKEHSENWEKSAVQQLWGWVHPGAVARACLLSVEKAENLNGCQVLNIVAPSTTQERASQDLAKKHYPNAEIRGDMSGNQGFWTTDKAERLLGWKHEEKE
ncbi:hypothetical protein BJX68DRAFT_270929 [Aspergillus pseudodeflectus]|uniref:NAD-dependent epimerase/dehydratase domain-containing protein n=1 Tax=Aspergillus pseudodeflectus TaxID=176178 RepID=A0ABR4JPL6_9EURO